jgi:hypothetical protein
MTAESKLDIASKPAGLIVWRTALVPVIGALGAAWFLTIGFWDDARQSLLVALSVIAAGVLVRLARGLPLSAAEDLELSEARSIVTAAKRVMRSLQHLIGITLATMIWLIILKATTAYLTSFGVLRPHSEVAERVLSALTGLLILYVFMRIIDVIKGDYDLVSLQGDFLVRQVERRTAAQFEKAQNRDAAQFKAPEGYGRRI